MAVFQTTDASGNDEVHGLCLACLAHEPLGLVGDEADHEIDAAAAQWLTNHVCPD